MRYLKKLFSIRSRDFLHLDYILLFCVFGIIGTSLVNIHRATNVFNGSHFVKMQLMFLAIGLVTLLLVVCMDYIRLLPLVDIFYWIVILMLIGVLLVGASRGVNGWFSLGPVKVQPAEFAKLAIVLMVSKKLHVYNGNINNVKVFFIVIFYAILPMLLMMLQPEMGLTMVSFFAVLFITFVMGLRLRVILGGAIFGAVSIFALLKTNLLSDLWRNRLNSFFVGGGDELADLYQLNTGMTAIGSGSVLGSKTPGYYLTIPEVHTDFIFAVIAENYGFIGSIIFISLYIMILMRLIKISKNAKDIFGKCVSIGIFGIFFFSLLQNIGMTIGIMPISGITLPLASYGGSSLITNLGAIGLALSIGMRKKKPQIGF